MESLPNVNLNKLRELHTNGGMSLLYHFLRHEPSKYMFEDFNSIMIFNEVKKGDAEEQHNSITLILNGNGIQ